MAITKGQKKGIIKDIEDKIARSKSIVFTRFFGVGANDINNLRDKFKEQNSEYLIAKKTLVDKAFAASDIEGVNVREFDGEIATIFGYEDEVAPAKIIDEFSKEHESVSFVGGVLEKKFLDADEVTALAKLPSKLELYAKIVGSMNAPISGFVNVLAGNIRGLVNVLKAIEDKR